MNEEDVWESRKDKKKRLEQELEGKKECACKPEERETEFPDPLSGEMTRKILKKFNKERGDVCQEFAGALYEETAKDASIQRHSELFSQAGRGHLNRCLPTPWWRGSMPAVRARESVASHL
mmetsp:Transcript_15111/g.30632  ORF Transcript_15111/g.30632 Transcript_15111/m.30632 type:complete len:121 (+) Transcript_15111:517-879(+)